ncbi:MAG: hypothetical protein R6V44_14075 [Paracoccaceae bacterium]
MSLIESIANVVVGYGVAVPTQMLVFPWFGMQAAFAEHLAIGLAFAAVSLARSCMLRRLFEELRSRASTGRFSERPAATRAACPRE